MGRMGKRRSRKKKSECGHGFARILTDKPRGRSRHGSGDLMDYLLKTEPSEYAFADLQRDQATVWDGVSNPVALKNLRAMKPGERLVIYETGDHKSAIGIATVVSVDASDAKNPRVK